MKFNVTKYDVTYATKGGLTHSLSWLSHWFSPCLLTWRHIVFQSINIPQQCQHIVLIIMG